MSWIYFAVVLFWAIIFVIAVMMTRGALRGVGEPLATETEETQPASANGHIERAQPTTSSTSTGGARG
jgi:hypothetical protein